MISSFDDKMIVLEGSPKERGYLHGKQMKSQIKEVVERWKYHLLQGSRNNPDKLIAKFMENTHFLTAVKNGLLTYWRRLKESRMVRESSLTPSLPFNVEIRSGGIPNLRDNNPPNTVVLWEVLTKTRIPPY